MEYPPSNCLFSPTQARGQRLEGVVNRENVAKVLSVRASAYGVMVRGLLCLASLGQAGVRRDDVADSEFLNLAASALYQSVGKFTYSVGSGSYIASGVLISPEWVLTAAHVTGGTNYAGQGISNMNFSLNTEGGVLSFAAAEWLTHPGWATTQGNLLAGYDVGLVRLSSSVTAVQAATLYLQETLAIQAGTIVGYGATGTGLTGYGGGTSGTKRAGQNMIDAQGDGETISSAILFVDFDRPGVPGESVTGGNVPLPLEYLSAPGDSGGGLFITQNSQTFLVGVTSFGWGYTDGVANSDYGDLAGFTSTTAYAGWISSVTGVPIPEPTSSSLLILSLVAWLRRRGRSHPDKKSS